MKSRTSFRQAVAATVLLALASAVSPAYATLCPLTQGFWKTHPTAWGSVTQLSIGGVNYSKAELLGILKTPPSGNAVLILAHQLIAAEVNILTGSGFFPDPIGDTITAGLASISQACGLIKPLCNVAPSTPIGQQMVALAATIDAFNNGKLTPGCIPR